MNMMAPLPADIRLMNLLTRLLLGSVLVMALSALVWWGVRQPVFNLEAVVVQGEVTRNNALTLKANVVPHMSGNFFTIALPQVQEAFESVPWVRQAVVHRVFPNRLRVDLLEHHPVALWGDEGGNAMLNMQGDVFDANVAEVESDGLPRLRGPEALSHQVLQMHGRLQALLKGFDMTIEALELSARGSWSLRTDRGAVIELGRGTPDELHARLQGFLRSLPQVASHYGRTPKALLAADLRHKDGYALRLDGVSTLQASGNKP